jgi:hypothetical protein
LPLLNANFVTAFFSAAAQDPAATDRFHPAAKAVNLLAFTAVWLVSSFHLGKTVP